MKRPHDLNKNTYLTAGVLSIAGCFLMIRYPEISLSGVRSGIDLFLDSVLPTLFPFFVLVNFMGMLEIPAQISKVFEPVFRRIFRCSGMGAYIWMFSLFSGYPMAAKLVGEFTRNGVMSTDEGRRILSFSCVSGPLFMIGTVGTAMLGDPILGYVIALGHYLGAMLNGLVWCRMILPATAWGGRRSAGDSPAKRPSVSFFGAMSDAILKAFQTMGVILGYIILFSVISEFLLRSSHLGSCDDSVWGALISGCLEMTIGCRSVSQIRGLSGSVLLGFCGFLLGFGGCSIAGQSLSMLAGSGIGSADYFSMKLSQGVLTGILTGLLTKAIQAWGLLDFPVGLIYGTDDPTILLLGRIHTWIYTSRSMGCIIGLIVLLLYIERRNTKV